MRVVSFDFETALIRPGVCAPEAACLTWQTWSDRNPVIEPAKILHAKDAEPTFRAWLEDKERVFVGANTSFDMAVAAANWPWLTDLIWDAYETDRVTDCQIREQLLDIAKGTFQGFHTPDGGWIKPKYNLADVAKRYGMQLDKPRSVMGPNGKMWDDPLHIRLRYQEIKHLALEAWDEYARLAGFNGPPPTVYAKEDSEATLLAWLGQEQHKKWLGLQYEFTRRAWCLHLSSSWGARTNAPRVAALIERAQLERQRVQGFLVEHGLVRENGSRDTKAAQALMIRVCADKGMRVPVTPTGAPQLGEDACDSTEDPLLEAYADFGRFGAVIAKDGAMLAKGTVYPIHTRYNMAATGRTTSSKPNMANMGRDVGPRECFVPRPGMIFVQADYEALELRTLAQVCVKLFGKSRLAEALNAGMDPHLLMAADMLNITYEEAKRRKKLKDPTIDAARQTAKVANFGFPGGLGAEKLVLWARKTYGVIFTVERARELKVQWQNSWPEMRDFLEYINRLCNNAAGTAFVDVPLSGWKRGDAPYCAAANTFFQSLGASAAGRGIWYLQRACYRDRSSVLFGSRMINHIHDENIGEVKDDALAHDKAVEWERLMVKGANEYLPDVPATAPALLMSYWSKSAFQLLAPDNKMRPWGGEWQCECGEVFTGPVAWEYDTKGERKELKDCAHHTIRWLDTLAA